MGNKQNQQKDLVVKECLYRFLARESAKGAVDMFTFRCKALRYKLVSSDNEFSGAMNKLVKEERILTRNKVVMINPEKVERGQYIVKNNKGFIISGSGRYEIDIRDCTIGKPNERVVVGFNYYDGSRKVPFIISKGSDFVLDGKSEEERYRPSYFAETLRDDNDKVYGRVMKTSQDNLVFVPNNKLKFRKNIVILNDKTTLSQYQDKICSLRLTSGESLDKCAEGVIEEIIGEAGNPIIEYDTIAESHGANMDWDNANLQKEIADIPSEVDLSIYTLTDENGNKISGHGKEIVDLRDLPFTTTDPATCKDMDDAIYSTFDENGNLVVYTAVANVSKYVDINSEIGKVYINGGFTTYAPNKAYNILPPQLSTNICSLNPNCDRLAFVVKTTVDPNTGIPIKSKIMDAVIRSHEKYSYEEAQNICDVHKYTLKQLQDKIREGKQLSKKEQVVMNEKAADILWKGFEQRDILRFETKSEYNVSFSEDMSEVLDIALEPDLKYHQVIEAFMLTANEATAEFADKNGIPIMYRVHGEPKTSKLDQANEFLTSLKIPFDYDLSPFAIKRIVQSIKGTRKEKLVNNFLVRMQNKAKYSLYLDPKHRGFNLLNYTKEGQRKQNAGKSELNGREAQDYVEFKVIEDPKKPLSHFGLQSKNYAHSTSPIRRTSDYVTHYNILAYMHGEKMLSPDIVHDICDIANLRQDEVDMAEREFNEVNSVLYCEKHIGEKMTGNVSAFKRIISEDGFENGQIIVVVEDENKGIKVEIPAEEIIAAKSLSMQDASLSLFGTAIINNRTRKPILQLCEDVSFVVKDVDKTTRRVYATIPQNIQKNNGSQKQEETILEK